MAVRVGKRGALLMSAGLIVVIACGYLLYAMTKPRRDLIRLLRGDEAVALTAITLRWKGETVTVSDPASTEYLTRAFREAEGGSYRLGHLLHTEIRLSTGGTTQCVVDVTTDLKTLTVSFPDALVPDRLDNYYLVRLSDPMPEDLARQLSALRSKWEQNHLG